MERNHRIWKSESAVTCHYERLTPDIGTSQLIQNLTFIRNILVGVSVTTSQLVQNVTFIRNILVGVSVTSIC